MHLAVLGATGATGRHLVTQALDRGHRVTALAREPTHLDLPPSTRLRSAAADVGDPASVARALRGAEAVLSGLGAAPGSPSNLLTAGARVLAAAAPIRIIWLGAFGTGESAAAAGPLTRLVLAAALRSELPDKVSADSIVLAAGGTVFHAGPLTTGPLDPRSCRLPLDAVPRRLLPRPISRATVAATMLDELEDLRHEGQVVVPLSGRGWVSHNAARPAG